MQGRFNRASGADHKDIHTRITERIVADLERGVRPWAKPWDAGNIPIRPLRHDGNPYHGINVLVLWSEATDRGYLSPFWMTFRQAVELGGRVRKGEHGSPVVYASAMIKLEENEQGEEEERKIPFLKGYTVFNAGQIDGLPDHFYVRPEPKLSPPQRIAHADQFFANLGAEIRHGGGQAFYAKGGDYIQMPPVESFRDAESFYATLAHESIHWTRHESRLQREFGRKVFGDEGYAKEELVAELGAAFLCTDLELTPEPREDHAAYIANWLTVLKGDKRFIFTASGHAQHAVDFLHARQPEEPQAQPETESRTEIAGGDQLTLF